MLVESWHDDYCMQFNEPIQILPSLHLTGYQPQITQHAVGIPHTSTASNTIHQLGNESAEL